MALLEITPPITGVTYYMSYRAADDSPLVRSLVGAAHSPKAERRANGAGQEGALGRTSAGTR